MAVTAKWYGPGLKALCNKEIDWDSDSIRAMLTTATYVPNQDTHGYKSDVTNEITGTGYTAGGVLLTTIPLSYDAGSNRVILDANDISWPSATFTARNLVIYDDTPATAATKPLLGFVDFGADQSPSGITFSVIWDALGVLNLTAA
ncbi:hypothetical protein [Nocardia sp. CC201C]|uniref:hypothetical protein n=1 Tax=Nocardia sp. CC201C TaxID=3044575 RepID=UPI0024A7AEB1|nr:hypothetical protein [Nocardia sp. CC201C]